MNSTNYLIVRNFARILLRVDDEYLCRTFEITSHEIDLPIKKGLIAICSDGDIATGRIAGFVDEWWEATQSETAIVSSPGFQYSVERNAFGLIPLLKIVFQEGRFLLGERYGDRLASRRSGLIADLDEAKSFDDFPVIWKCSPTIKLS
jgi:hypothetical protein